MPGKRRSTKGLPPVPREYIVQLVKRALEHWPEPLGLRNAALIALTYLSGRRASEVLALKRDQVRLMPGYMVLLNVRILKRFVKDRETGEKKPVVENISIPVRDDDPLVQVVRAYLDWYDREKPGWENLWGIRTRQRFWQIVREIDPEIWPHWLRHQRASHLAQVLNPFELREKMAWAKLDTAIEYVHSVADKKIREAGI